jgi:glutamate carboxypeptidase
MAWSQELNELERRIVEHVDEHLEESIAVLNDFVEINSGTLNLQGVRAVGEALVPRFEALGFSVHWEEMPAETKRAGKLFAKRKGGRGKSILLIGHLDTVFEPDHDFQGFKRYREGERDLAMGPGVNDMKGGDVAILYALEALFEVGALEDRTITVVLTGDEERVGRPMAVARAGLVEAARRSSSSWKLVVEGRQAHSSGIFSERTGSGTQPASACGVS